MDLKSPILDSDNESDPDELVLDTDYDFPSVETSPTSNTVNHKIGSVWRDMVVGEQMEECLTHLEVTSKTATYTDMDDPNYKPTTNGRKRKRAFSNLKTENLSNKRECDLESNHVVKKRVSRSKGDLDKCNYKYVNSKGFVDKKDIRENKQQKCRVLPIICDFEEKSDNQFIEELCTNLHEHNKILISSVVSKIDRKIIVEKYTKTSLIEANGGQMIKNGNRRRTSGGIFFNLIKEDKSIPNSAKKDLFGSCQNEEIKKKKKRDKIKRRIKKEKLKKMIEQDKKEADNLKQLNEKLESFLPNSVLANGNLSDTLISNEN